MASIKVQGVTNLNLFHILMKKVLSIMANLNYVPVTGVVLNVTPVSGQCCNLMVTIRTSNGIVNLTISPDTYVIDNVLIRPGMQIIGFYDANAPVPLIFPPQYRAIVIGRTRPRESIAFNFFDSTLTASDNSLKLNINNSTQIVSSNGQSYSCSPSNQYLIVYYSVTTRSIPPQTAPRKIIVMC